MTCHNDELVNGDGAASSALVSQLRTAGLALDTMDLANVAADTAEWERVVRKLQAGVMPPSGRPRPDESAQDIFVGWLETELGRLATLNPDPGHTAALHRLNRTEYRNAIRDLLALDIDIVDFLPADDSSYGFDNIGGVLRMSQSLLERYLTAAKTISRMALGGLPPTAQSETYRNAQDLQQHDRIDGLPFGTRGGMSVGHFFPQDAHYEIQVALAGNRGVREPHRLEVTVDGEQVELFDLSQTGPDGEPNPLAGSSTFEVRIPIVAGPHDIAVARRHRLAS